MMIDDDETPQFNILKHSLFVKALGLVSPCLYALTSFSAGHEIANILNTDFCQFFLLLKGSISVIEIMK